MTTYARLTSCFLLWYAMSVGSFQPAVCVITHAGFSRQPLCGLDLSSHRQPSEARSPIECLMFCSESLSCDTVIYVTSSNSCYDNVGCGVDPTCSSFDPDYYYYHRKGSSCGSQTTPVPCLNGGQRDQQTGVCDCSNTGGYAGDLCQFSITTCQALADTGVSPGSYPIAMDLFGDLSIIVQTHCVLRSWKKSFTVLRSSGTVDKKLSWDDYVNGFWLSEEDYWFGLENLHLFTSRGTSYRARFGVSFGSPTVRGEILESVANFVVGPASSGYAYICNSYSSRASNIYMSGTQYLQDFLVSQSGKPFSTADNDQDEDGQRNCAELAGSGWWFGSCDPFTANPLGWSYTALPGPTTDSHIRLPGVDMSRSEFISAFQRVYLTIDL